MAFSSHNTFEGVDDEAFDQYFDQHFDQTFENLFVDYDGQEDETKRRKNEFISREIVNKATHGYGMIISVILQHILTFFSDAILE